MQSLAFRSLVLTMALMLSACVSYAPRYGADGVYGGHGGFDYSNAPSYRSYSAWYPYWSLDHFYFSRYYSPYSIVIHPWDPWLYPYAGWYWGYAYAHHRFLIGGPGYYWSPWAYHRHRPWHDHRHRWSYPDSINYRDRRMSYGTGELRPSARHQAHRLDRLEQRRARQDGGGGLQRQRPVVRQPSRSPVTRRAPSPSSRPASRSSRSARTPERIRNRPPEA